MGNYKPQPCLVCGTDTLGPKAGTVCNECRRKVKDYDELRASLQVGQVSITLPLYPKLHYPSANRHPKREQLETLMRTLRQQLDQPRRRDSLYYYSHAPGETAPKFEGKPTLERKHYGSTDYTTFNVDERLAQVLLDLEPMISEAMEESEAIGKSNGTNLLAQLANGTLTSPDFEKKVLK